jgi:POT family proton-dependent oligopeptide transporter
LTIVIFAPILNYAFYPWMAKIGYELKPMTRMTIGFALAGINMIIAAIIQWKVEQSSPCGVYATSDCAGVSDVSLWWQVPMYSLPAIGELFVNVSSYELAYTRAPARMKSLIYALVLFTSAISSAIGLALTPVVVDPYLKWPYVALAAACFACCPVLMLCFKDLNKPVTFIDIDRMEGRQQPAVLAANKGVEEETGSAPAIDLPAYREDEKISKTA